MYVTKKKIDESAFIIAKDNITNNVQTVVVPSNFQVGLKTSPSDLTLTGKFSTSEKDYVANSSNNWTLSLEDHVTVSSISTTYSSSSQPSAGYVVINLPKNPRVGQLVIIKEFSGTASVISLRIYDASSKTIDGANYKTISSDYGALQFFWQGTNWISISNATVASGAAPDSASYVVIGSNAILTNERTLTAGSGISIVDGGAGAAVTISTTGGGSGDVIGPASSTDNAIVRFDLTTGKLIQNSGVTIDDSNNVTIPGDISVNGGDITTTAATTNLVNAATTINLGSTAVTRAINIGTNATNVQTINIGTGAAANIISIGSATGAASLALRAGTGDITISGIVKNSSQPGFLTTLSTSQLNFTTSSDVTVLFDSEIFDNASNFDTGAYTFTAPEAGKYLFNAAVRIDNIDTAADYYTLYLITSNRNYRLAIIDPGQFAADLVYWHLNGSAIADMDASDTAYIVIRQQAGTAQSDIISATTNSFFSGWMLG